MCILFSVAAFLFSFQNISHGCFLGSCIDWMVDLWLCIMLAVCSPVLVHSGFELVFVVVAVDAKHPPSLSFIGGSSSLISASSLFCLASVWTAEEKSANSVLFGFDWFCMFCQGILLSLSLSFFLLFFPFVFLLFLCASSLCSSLFTVPVWRWIILSGCC